MTRSASQPRRIDGLLDQFFRQSGLGHGSRFAAIRLAYTAVTRDMAEPALREHTAVAGWQRGTLTIEVANSALLAELSSFDSDQLLLRINRELETGGDNPRGGRPRGARILVQRLRFRLRGMGHL
jgi:hypothetical protein